MIDFIAFMVSGFTTHNKQSNAERCKIKVALNVYIYFQRSMESKQKHIVREFLAALREEEINQSQFAERCGLGSAYISRFVAGARPEDPLFYSICTKWVKKPELGQKIVLAHLLDEIERSGHSLSEFTLEASKVNSKDEALDTALHVLRREALDSGNVRNHIISMVPVVMRGTVRKEKAKRG